MAKRTVMYSSGGKKLYAVRDSEGQFKDIQSYARAHAMDIKRHDADDPDEGAPPKKKASKKSKKKAAKKAGKKKAAKKKSKKKTTKK